MSTQNVTQVETQAVHMCVASRPGHVCSAHVLDTCPVCVCLCHAHGDLDRWIDYAVVPRTPPKAKKDRPDARSGYAPSRVPVAVGERYPRAVPRRRPATGPAAVYRRLLAYTQGSWFKDKVRNYRTIEHTVETFGINT